MACSTRSSGSRLILAIELLPCRTKPSGPITSRAITAARRTRYRLWLDDSPEQVEAIWQARAEAQALRDSLPHDQRKKKPWGPL